MRLYETHLFGADPPNLAAVFTEGIRGVIFSLQKRVGCTKSEDLHQYVELAPFLIDGSSHSTCWPKCRKVKTITETFLNKKI